MENISNKLISSPIPPDPYFYEKEIWAQKGSICGIDEVGRGCLAGPVVTAAVILKPDAHHPLLQDSKILTERQRLTASAWILENSWNSYGIVDAPTIDAINIYQATQKAMKQAMYNLFSQPIPNPHLILIDAMPLTFCALPKSIQVLSFPFGESKSVSIAAASIIAKVKRDELMTRMNIFFPGYGLAVHKGYGTGQHQQALGKKGLSLIHRTTFIKEKGIQNEQSCHAQKSLFC